MRNLGPTASARRTVGAVLVEMLRSIPGPTASPDPAQFAQVDIAQLLRAAAYHGLEPALYVHLERTLDPQSAAFGQLKEAHLGQIMRHLRVLADVRLLGEALDSAQVPWVVVKGPVLAEAYWRRPDLRRYSDLDVVVERRSMPAVLDLLADIGGTPVDVNWTMILQQLRGEISYQLPSGSSLDLHWHVINERELRPHFPFPIARMLERRRVVALGTSQSVPTWDACDTVLHVACHFARSGGHHLIWMKDLELAAKAVDLDWDEVVDRARQYQLGLVMAATLRRVATVLGPVAPAAALRALSGRVSWTAVTTALDRLQPPQQLPSRGLSGRAAYACIRRTTWSSVLAAFKHVPMVLRARQHAGDTATGENVLHHEEGGAEARRAYLARLIGSKQP